jgi:hypothetical protein
MILASDSEQNFWLLLRLQERFYAKGFGSISNFFGVDHEWRCPSCFRSKPEIARLDKNENLLCALHDHHDHFWEEVSDKIDLRSYDWRARSAIEKSFSRFEPTLICSDCNVAEPAAKALVVAPRYFSFAPHEIASFIDVAVNVPHKIDMDRAVAVYAGAKPAMEILARRLKALILATRPEGSTFEPIGASMWRVLENTKRKQKGS